MITKVTKLGNSLTISIPQNLAQEISISEGSEINISVIDGNLVVKPKNSQKYTLDELVKGITPENLHREIDTGAIVGNEIW